MLCVLDIGGGRLLMKEESLEEVECVVSNKKKRGGEDWVLEIYTALI